MNTKLSRAEFSALGAIKRARDDNTSAMFRGTQLKLGGKSLNKAIKSVKEKAGSARKTATGLAKGSRGASAGSRAGIGIPGVSDQIKEMRAGNAILASNQPIGISVFSECPILGCYLLTCSDTSSVANLFVADIGLPGWMDKVELLKKQKMDPLLKIATAAINASRLQLENLSQNKGTHATPGFFASKKKAAMKYLGLN